MVVARAQEEQGHVSAADTSFNEALETLDAAPTTPGPEAGMRSTREGRAEGADQRAGDAYRGTCAAYAQFLERHGESVKALDVLKRAM